MEPRLQRRVQRYGWDRAAAHYEAAWHRQLEPAQKLLLELAALRPGERVLDIACGTGLVTFPAAVAVGSSGSIVGADISDVMVETCRRTASERGLAHATFQRMEAEALQFTDAEFDVVLCALGLMYVTDAPGSVREMCRVTRSGGRVVAAVWGRRDHCGWAEIFPIVDRRVQSEVCPMFFQLGNGALLGDLMTAAGCAHVRSERLATVLRYASAAEACVAAFAGGPVALAYSRFDTATRDTAHAEYLESIAPYRNGDGYEIPGEFVVVAGEKD